MLVVEDDEVHQVLIAEMLRQCIRQVEVQICADGDSALLALARGSPDLLVLDLALPDMDGRAVLALVQQEHPKTPVLVYSSNREALSSLDAQGNQGLTVLDKDSGAEEFTRLVPTLFKRRNSDHLRFASGRAADGRDVWA